MIQPSSCPFEWPNAFAPQHLSQPSALELHHNFSKLEIITAVTKDEAILVSCRTESVLMQTRCQVNTQCSTLLLPCHAGLPVDSSAKKSKPGLAPTADSAYNPADSSDLPSWITERVRVCQRLGPASAPYSLPLSPPAHQPAPAQQQQQQQPQSSSHGSAAFNQSNSTEPDFVLYWMRTALRGHENPALVCFLPTSQIPPAMLRQCYHSFCLWLPI